MRDHNPGRTIKVGNETMTTKGYNPPKPDPYESFMPAPEACPVPHQDVDNDDLRKRENSYRHSSYRK